jgi:RNA polymerase sigma factor (sigma-70 family)
MADDTTGDITRLIGRAAAARAAGADTGRAFGEIVRRFQDLAFACAYGVLGDFGHAEDAAQEAFLTAWRHLDQLKTPEAFPGWLRRIVLTHCHRQTRGARLETVPLETLHGLPSDAPDPYQAVAGRETRDEVRAAILALPEHERLVTALFYIRDYSQADIAAFLEVPLTTVKKRLYSARGRLRERMLHMVQDALQERRPSRDEGFANTVALYNEALESLLAKVKQDRNVIAVLLFGSLSHDQVWRKSDIDLVLICRTDKQARRELCLIENGVNIHASLTPRNTFKAALQGSLQNSFFHSSFAKSTLLYTTDETIRDFYDRLDTLGTRDRDMQLLRATGNVLYTLAKAEKWLYVKADLEYSFLWIMYTVDGLAKIETLLHGRPTGRETVGEALTLNPAFFGAVYTDLIHCPKDAGVVRAALERINAYLDGRLAALVGPVLDFLADAGGVRTTGELDDYFRKQAQAGSLCGVYEWLADKGILQKVPSPVRLTDKSSAALVDEAAYYYDGAPVRKASGVETP